MKILTKVRRVVFMVFYTMTLMVVTSGLHLKATVDEDVNNAIKKAYATQALAGQITAFDGIVQTYGKQQLSNQTKDAYFNALSTVTNNILNRFERREQGLPLDDLSLLLASSQGSNLLSPTQSNQLQSIANKISIEQLVFGLASEKDNDLRQSKLRTILRNATGISFSSVIQDAFFAALDASFRARVDATGAQLQKIAYTTQLKNNLIAAVSSPLLRSGQQATINNYLEALTFELSVVGLLAMTAYADQVKGLGDLLGATLPIAVYPETQAIFSNVVQKIISGRNSVAPATFMQQPIHAQLLTVLSKIQDASVTIRNLKPFIAQSLQTVTYEKSIVDAAAVADYGAQLAAVTTVIANARGVVIEAATQNLLSALLESMFDKRPRASFDLMAQLSIVFKSALQTNVLNATQKVQLQGLLNTLLAELQGLQTLATATSALDAATNADRIAALTKLLGDNQGRPLSAQAQSAVFASLQKTYESRQQILDELTSIKNLLENWLKSNLLTAEQNNTISTVWLPTLTGEIASLTMTQQAQSIAGLGDAKSQSEGLTKFLASNQGATLTPDAQNSLFAALQNIFNTRAQTISGLTAVKNILTNWLNSNLLSATQNAALTEWIATIEKDIVALQFKQQVGALAGIKDPQVLAEELAQLLANNAGNQLDEATQIAVFASLQKLFNARKKNVASLTSLQTLLTNWLNSNLLNVAQNTTISGQWLPTITSELQALARNAEIQAALAGPQTAQSMTQLLSLIPDGAVLDAVLRDKIFGQLKALYDGRTQDVAALQALQTLFEQWLAKNVFTSQQVKTINAWLAVLKKQIAQLLAQQNVASALASGQATPEALSGILQNIQNTKTPLTPDMQNQIFQSLTQAYNSRTQEVNALTSLQTTLSAWLASKRLTAGQNQVIKGTWLPTITKEIKALQQIQQVGQGNAAAGDYSQLLAFLKANGKTPLSPSVLDATFTQLQNAFNNRQQDPTSLKALQDLLNKWLYSKLLTDAQKTQIKSWLRTIAQEIIDLAKGIQPTTGASAGTLPTATIGGVPVSSGGVGGQLPSVNIGGVPTSASSGAGTATSPLTGVDTGVSVGGYPTTSIVGGIISPTVATSGNVPVATIPTKGMSANDASIVQGINNALQLQNPAARVDALAVILNSLVGQNVSNQVRNAYAQALQILVYSTNISDSAVQKRVYDLSQALLGASLLADTQKQFVKNTILPKVGIPTINIQAPGTQVAGVPVTQNITVALQQANVQNQINSLMVILKSLGQQQANAGVQNAFAKAIQQISIGSGGLSPEQLRALISLLTLALGSNLLAQTQKDYIKNTLLPALGLSSAALSIDVMQVVKPTMSIQENISAILQYPDQGAKIDSLKFILASLGGNILDASTKNVIANAVQQVFSTTDVKDVALRQMLDDLLKQTRTGGVLTPAQQQYVATNLKGQLAQTTVTPSDKNLAKIFAMKDSVKQIDALALFVKGAAGKTFAPTLQTQVAGLLDDLSAKSQTLGAKGLAKFIKLLDAIKASPLLSADQQAAIVATLLPMAKSSMEALGTTAKTPTKATTVKKSVAKKTSGKAKTTATKTTAAAASVGAGATITVVDPETGKSKKLPVTLNAQGQPVVAVTDPKTGKKVQVAVASDANGKPIVALPTSTGTATVTAKATTTKAASTKKKNSSDGKAAVPAGSTVTITNPDTGLPETFTTTINPKTGKAEVTVKNPKTGKQVKVPVETDPATGEPVVAIPTKTGKVAVAAKPKAPAVPAGSTVTITNPETGLPETFATTINPKTGKTEITVKDPKTGKQVKVPVETDPATGEPVVAIPTKTGPVSVPAKPAAPKEQPVKIFNPNTGREEIAVPTVNPTTGEPEIIVKDAAGKDVKVVVKKDPKTGGDAVVIPTPQGPVSVPAKLAAPKEQPIKYFNPNTGEEEIAVPTVNPTTGEPEIIVKDAAGKDVKVVVKKDPKTGGDAVVIPTPQGPVSVPATPAAPAVQPITIVNPVTGKSETYVPTINPVTGQPEITVTDPRTGKPVQVPVTTSASGQPQVAVPNASGGTSVVPATPAAPAVTQGTTITITNPTTGKVETLPVTISPVTGQPVVTVIDPKTGKPVQVPVTTSPTGQPVVAIPTAMGMVSVVATPVVPVAPAQVGSTITIKDPITGQTTVLPVTLNASGQSIVTVTDPRTGQIVQVPVMIDAKGQMSVAVPTASGVVTITAVAAAAKAVKPVAVKKPVKAKASGKVKDIVKKAGRKTTTVKKPASTTPLAQLSRDERVKLLAKKKAAKKK